MMAKSKDGGLLKSDVFDRTRPKGALVSPATYNLVIGLTLCWGFLVNWLIVKQIDTQTLLSIPVLFFFIAYFASCFLGIYLFNTYTEPAISFIGYNFVVVPFGLVLNIVISRYDPTLVLEAIQVTALVTIVMMLLGAAFPDFFKSISTTLLISLFAMIFIELFQIFVLGRVNEWVDWVVAIIFCGYIGYDWGRANQIPKTTDNAIDSAAAIYMDIINLFVRILRILGRRK
jgi:FtsH-binding integral membrane protein